MNSEITFLLVSIASVCTGGILIADGIGPYEVEPFKLAGGAAIFVALAVYGAYKRMPK